MSSKKKIAIDVVYIIVAITVVLLVALSDLSPIIAMFIGQLSIILPQYLAKYVNRLE